jgi:hypothetical protein
MFRNTLRFHGEELLAPRPTPKLDGHPLSAVRDCLFNIFAATLHIEGRSSIRNLQTRHAVVTETHLSHGRKRIKNLFLVSAFRQYCKLTHHQKSVQQAVYALGTK